MCLCECYSLEQCLMWLLPGRDVPLGNWDFPGMITWVSMRSPNAVAFGEAADCSISSWTTARSFNSTSPSIVSLPWKLPCTCFPSRMPQFINLCLLLPNTLHVLLCHFGDCVHHPAGFIILAQLAQLSIKGISIRICLIVLITQTLQHCSDCLR